MTDYADKIVELRADVHTMWKLQCQNLYNSKNLAALAVRECLQNSIDSVLSAIKSGIVAQGKISVGIEDNDFWVEDNGIGMDIPTLHDKFLTLGGTTKGDEDNVGGFGLAKSVILGCGSGFKVETQDNVFTSEDLGKNPIRKQQYRQGTKITLYNAQVDTNELIGDKSWEFKWSVDDYIESSEIPKSIEVYVDGELCKSKFKPTKTTKRLPAEFGIANNIIPDSTDLRLNVYKATSAAKYLYVRLRGLTQFKMYLGWNANCDIVLDIDTKLDPRSREYPFSTNREGLKAQYQGIIEAIRDTVSKSPLSISRDNRYKETLYDNVDDGSKSSVNATRELTELIVSSQVVSTVREVNKVVTDIKSKGGFNPQGGYNPATLLDYMSQYNSEIEKAADENKVSKAELVKRVVPNTLFKLNNPLSHSWLIYEDREYEHEKISKSALVSLTVVWDTILKLMANNCRNVIYNKVFYPGIIMERNVLGMCLKRFITKGEDSEKRCYVMVNPFMIPKGSSTKIALFLMGVAAHELAHMACDTLEAHGETFSYTREAIMNYNLDELENITSIVEKSKICKVLKLNTPTTNYRNVDTSQLMELAKESGIDVEELKQRYPNAGIFRMRLVMALKKVGGNKND